MKKIFNLPSILLSATAKDTYLIFANNIFTSFLAFLYTIFLARSFPPDKLGIFASVTAFILLASDVLDMGITTSLSRFYPEMEGSKGEKWADKFIVNTFKFQLTVTLILVTLVIIMSSFLSSILLKSDNYSALFYLAGTGILGTVLTSFVSATLSAKKKFLPVAIISSSSTALKLVLVLILYYLHRFTLNSVTFSFILAPFFAFLVGKKFIPLVLTKNGFSFALLKKLLSYSLLVALARFFSAISSRFDALMLIPLSSSFEAGIYSAANKIIYTYVVLSGSFSMVIAPRLSSFKDLSQSIAYLKKIILVVVFILISMAVMYLIAPFFVVFVLGRNYYQSVVVFRALLLPMAFFVSTIPTVNFLLYVLKKPVVSALNTFIQLPIIFFGNLYFIPVFGRLGPVFSLTIAYSVTFFSSVIFTFYFLNKVKKPAK